MNKGMFNTGNSEWETPPEIFEPLKREFGITLDVCATDLNTKCTRHFTKAADGLTRDWPAECCWMNPPYGRQIRKWVKKAYEESQRGATVVCLLPARTDTAWWHDYCMKGEVRFLRGRIYFLKPGGAEGGRAPFPSAIVIFRPQNAQE